MGDIPDRAYVVGTFDTKGAELEFIAGRLRASGVTVVTVDLGTSGVAGAADVSSSDVAAHHPAGAGAVFTADRGAAVTAMAAAFAAYILSRNDVGGIIAAGGSGGTALATQAMRALPVGCPKVMVSTVASGNIAPYIGASDIAMMYSVTDVAGLNRISRVVLGNAAHALAGMMRGRIDPSLAAAATRRVVGLTMFGVTTPCVQAVQRRLEAEFDCLTFHATGTGGQSMEKLVDSGLISGVIDVTTTEVADLLVGGIFKAHDDRFGAMARKAVPYAGSCGALDMVNFGARDTVPVAFAGRTFHSHNAQVTLMRTTPDECAAIGRFIAARLNAMLGPVRFLLPELGISTIAVAGGPFHDPAADQALFDALEQGFLPSANHRIERLPLAINDPAFAMALADAFREIA